MTVTPPTNLAATASSSLTAPTITTTKLPTATTGIAYSGTISATGGVPPYTWSINAGSLPPGLALQALLGTSVNITGTPTVVGTYTFAILCTDSNSQATQISLMMEHPL